MGANLLLNSLFKELNNYGIDAWFIGGVPFSEEANPELIKLSKREIVIKIFTSRWNFISTVNYNNFQEFNEFLKEIKPNIFNYINIGMNLFCYVKNLFSQFKIVLTLHDFKCSLF